uniref:Trans-1,2-dihydrobenzene-1,2-diol dehydrogenase n=1 Tax=Lepeophtheirus salmonis TaxID=72036 RepID=C1BSM0_LEPSM|nr:Trans-1,2-dihydrobenzene-1,2-diol dehydrogenase [Lepeophtheirus salmonis]
MPSALRWGIVSTGKIANDFVTAIKNVLNPLDHSIIAVSSRSISTARKFAERFSIPKVYEGIEDLIQDNEIDVVYIASLNIEHYGMAKAAIEAGKNVLCEKPMGMNLKMTESLINLAKEKNVFLMEAIWSRFLPSYSVLRSHLDSIGEVKYVLVEFGRKIYNERIRRMDLGGGTVLDLGVYCVQFLNLVFKGEEPIEILTTGSLNSEGTDKNISSIFKYGLNGGGIGIISTHSEINLPCEAKVIGSKGSLTVKFPFWASENIEYKLESGNHSELIENPLPVLPKNSNHYYNFVNSAGLAFEAQHVKECLDKGLKESPLLSFTDITQISKCMEKIRKDVGVVYPQDSEL